MATAPTSISSGTYLNPNAASKPGEAYVWDSTASKWVQPPKPADNKIYSWDNTKGWVDTGKVNTTVLAAATGFVLSQVLIEDPTYGAGPNGLKNVYDLWAQGKETEALQAYFKSDWYTKLGKTSAERYSLSLNQPEVYKQELAVYMMAQKQRLAQLGVKIDDPALDDYLEQAFKGNLSDLQVNALVAKSKDFGHKFSGDVLTTIQNAREYARAMGVSYSEDAYTAWGKSLFLGDITDSEIQANIRTTAASAFPVYADLINKGVTMDSIAAAYKQSMANILEINPNGISLYDETLRRAMQGQEQMPLWQFENQLRQDVRWQYTNNAREGAYNMVNTVLTDFGLKG